METGKTLFHYRLIEKIGEGGMGVVWKAVDTTLDREVAIKVLPEGFADDPERVARFEREAKLLASLHHPNIASIFGMHEANGVRFLAMELVAGEDLSQRIERGPLPLDDALEIARQIAEALEAAHDNGVVHRDLKPANVKISPDGKVKVLDLGLAKAWSPDPASSSSASPEHSPTLTSAGTRAGMILGTAAYMSPEQARGHAVDRRADIWALGCVLYEMLTGRQIFEGETTSDTLAAVLRAEIDLDGLPAGTPAEIRRLLIRCLDRDPRRRLRDAGELRVAAEYWTSGSDSAPGAEAVAVAAPDAQPDKRRLGLIWLLLPVALISGLILGAVFLDGGATTHQVVRVSVLPPEGAELFNTSRQPGPVTLSPDGKRLTFVARDAERKVLLWIRELDSDEAVPLPGTEDASYPFWSPDSRSVGFFADGKMKRVDADGGTLLTLCDATFGKGGSWSSDGRILFAPSYNTGIHVVSAEGGEPTAVTILDPESNANSHRFPELLPDEEHFLFLARVSRSREAPDNVVMIGSLNGSEPRELVRSPVQATFAAGHLLYLRERILVARPFDAQRLDFTGEPFVIAEGVQTIAGAARGVFSAGDSGTLVYQQGGSDSISRLAWFDREGRIAGNLGDPGTAYTLSISPDGSRVAAAIETGSKQDIWVVDTERGTRRRVTFDPGESLDPIWYPDSRRIAYRTRDQGVLDIYAKAADGSGDSKLLLTTELDKIPTSISPDGRHLAFSTTPEETAFDIWMLPLEDGGEPFPFIATPSREEWARFSPDGRWVAYQSNETGREEIYITSFPVQDRRVQVSIDGGQYPRWGTDGKELFFMALDDSVMVAGVSATGSGIEVGEPELLFSLSVPAYGNYDALGDRLLIETELEGRDRSPLALVLNWPELGDDRRQSRP
jgi:Tol biopolymer transport system component